MTTAAKYIMHVLKAIPVSKLKYIHFISPKKVRISSITGATSKGEKRGEALHVRSVPKRQECSKTSGLAQESRVTWSAVITTGDKELQPEQEGLQHRASSNIIKRRP